MKISFFSFLFSLNHILLNCHSFPAIINYITNIHKIAATASTHKAKCPKAHRKKTHRKNYNLHRGLQLTNRLASLCWKERDLLARRRKAAEEEEARKQQQQQKAERKRDTERESVMRKVRDGLYIGNITDAAAVLSSAAADSSRRLSPAAAAAAVTHLLSLISRGINPLDFKRPAHIPDPDQELQQAAGEQPCTPIPSSSSSSSPASSSAGNRKLKKLTVPLLDSQSQNLLDHLDECLEFIESGRKDGGIVLVHCFAGVSRSGAVVTAYLMKKECLTMDNALESLKKASEIVCPNDGFRQQLLMFEEMGCTVNHESDVYKTFQLAKKGDADTRRQQIGISGYAADPAGHTITEKNNSLVSGDKWLLTSHPSTVYRCKKCRQVVASEENVITHIPGAGLTSFKWRKRGVKGSGTDEPVQPECTSIFVQPMQWMTPVQEGMVESKLQCVKCEARLGNFNWAGMQCSCGTWVNPAFQLHKSRVDAAPL